MSGLELAKIVLALGAVGIVGGAIAYAIRAIRKSGAADERVENSEARADEANKQADALADAPLDPGDQLRVLDRLRDSDRSD